MAEQVYMYDVITPTPTMWECVKTCKHFGENIDYPEWWFGKPRCLLPDGNCMKSILFDNRWFCYCTKYERREDDVRQETTL